jgi:hypothetical protein
VGRRDCLNEGRRLSVDKTVVQLAAVATPVTHAASLATNAYLTCASQVGAADISSCTKRDRPPAHAHQHIQCSQFLEGIIQLASGADVDRPSRQACSSASVCDGRQACPP